MDNTGDLPNNSAAIEHGDASEIDDNLLPTGSIEGQAQKQEKLEQGESQEPQQGWRRFRQWMHCFCVVTFDLELGQTLELLYPSDAQLTQLERSDLCYLAFPDSNCSSSLSSSPSLSNGLKSTKSDVKASADSAHHFRIRRNSSVESTSKIISPDKISDAIARQLPAYLRPDPQFLYGFAHFRRQRDPGLPRGYSQKSIVLLSQLPFVALFSRVVSEVAAAYFAGSQIALETACRQIDQHWPMPLAGGDHLLSLPLFGLRFCCAIPAADCNVGEAAFTVEHFEESARPREEEEDEEDFHMVELHNNAVLLESIHETDQHFHVGIKRILPHLHLLWELVLLGEPLLLMAPSPALSSSLVQALVSLICPLRCQADFRPYFTIHDSDFNEVCARQHNRMNNTILGVTNPFFLKALAHWPHVLKIGGHSGHKGLRRERSESRLISQFRAQPALFVLASLKRNGTTAKGLEQIGQREDEEDKQTAIKRHSELAQLERHSAGGFLSSHRQMLAPDKALPRKLLRTPSDSGSQWAALRWHFAELTRSFMSPLESYIATLMPLRREISPFQPVLQMRPFSLEQFLASLKHFGHPGVKGDWQGLYRQFTTRSPNFIGWLRQRQLDIERQLRLEHMEIICNAQFSAHFLAKRSQVEIVDLVLKLSNRLSELEGRRLAATSPERTVSTSNSPGKVDQLRTQLRRILASVDADLRLVLLSNPAFSKAAQQHGQITN